MNYAVETDLDAVLNSAQKESIVISRAGKPSAVLVGIEGYDAEDLSLSTSKEFWHMIQQRRSHGKSLTLEEVETRLLTSPRKRVDKRVATKKSRKHA